MDLVLYQETPDQYLVGLDLADDGVWIPKSEVISLTELSRALQVRFVRVELSPSAIAMLKKPPHKPHLKLKS